MSHYLLRVERVAALAVAAVVAGCATGVASGPHGIEYYSPSMSPDGQHIMVGARDYDRGEYLEVMRADGRGLISISANH